MRDFASEEKYLKLLDFTYFARRITFSKSDRKDKKKSILNGIQVEVVLDMVSVNTKENKSK